MEIAEDEQEIKSSNTSIGRKKQEIQGKKLFKCKVIQRDKNANTKEINKWHKQMKEREKERERLGEIKNIK